MNLTIPFKKGDFKQANFYNNYDCPIHRALRREFPNASIAVGGKTVTMINEAGAKERLQIGEMRMNGALMNPKGLGTRTLENIHLAIRYKHFKEATIALTTL